MKKSQILKAGTASFALSLALVSAPAFAQDATDAAAQPVAQEEAATTGDDPIVVTGSLIKNPNLERSTPVNVTTADDIEMLQSNVAEEILREIPGVVPSIGSAVNNGNGGSSFVNLRGLGENRNIVLLDGTRMTPADLGGLFDLNNVPLALIERVDVLTGGASTTYGADAVSGVVNFVTRRDFAGMEATAGYQLTEQGDGAVFRADVTVGANFDDGRGNAVLSIGYQEADPVYQGARAFSQNSIDSYSGNISGSGTATPSRFSGTRGFGAAAGSSHLIVGQTTDADGNIIPILAPNPNGAANGGTRQVDELGRAVAPYSTFNFNPYNIFQTPFKRYNMFGSARYEVSDAVEVYTRGLFSKNVVSTVVAPSGAFGLPVTINLNNPYLPASLRNQFCAFNTAPSVTGVDANGNPVSGQVGYTPRFTQAQCDAAATATGPDDPNYRTVTTNISRRASEYGPRVSDFTTTYFDYKLGFRGGITDSIDWDIFGAYGESENVQVQKGYWLNSRVRQALLANNVNECINPANGCVPLNVFGPDGSISAGMNAFLNAESQVSVKTTLAQARGTISGDLGFAVPMANDPIAFAVGAEYRNYTAKQQSDLLSQSGDMGGAGGASPNIDGGFKVWEAFGELVLPLIQDKPFFDDLTLEGGIRYSSYSIDAPGKPKFDTWTWKAGGSWSPVSGVKVRGNYAHAVRAPNIGELFSPLNTVLTNLAVDPCAGAAPVADANLAAVCRMQGAPANSIGNIENPSSGQANSVQGGLLSLQPETSNSWTLGLVLQPSALSGFSASLDYYNIKIKDAITSATPGDAINACYGNITAASVNDPNCTVIRRNPLTGGLDGDSQTTPGLYLPLSNSGKLSTDGFDLAVNYKRDIGFADFSYAFNGNWTRSSKFQAIPTSLNRECTGYYSANCASIQPEWSFSQRFTLGFEDVDVSLLWRYLSKSQFEPQQIADDLQSAIDAGCANPETTDDDDCMVNPEFRKIPAKHYFDLTTRFMVTDNLSVTLTAQNLFNTKPKVVGGSVGSTSYNSGNVYPSTYDALGRRYGVAVKLKF